MMTGGSGSIGRRYAALERIAGAVSAARTLEKLRDDRVAFAAAVGFPALDPWQRQVVESRSQRIILNCARQVGKSTVVSILAAHQALYQPESLTLIVAGQAQRQGNELLRKVTSKYRALGHPAPVAIERESTLCLELANKSRVISLPSTEASNLGYSSVNLLIFDEAAYVPDPVYYLLDAVLARSGGRQFLLSTPYAARGFYHACWTAPSEAGWERYRLQGDECGHYKPDTATYLARKRHELPDPVYRSQYCCEFVDPISAAFSQSEIDTAFDEEIEEWQL